MTKPKIKDSDVADLLSPLRPGSLHTIAALYETYTKMAEAAGRPAASDLALGRALRRFGCNNRVVYRGKGKRGLQKRSYVVSWEVPGRPPGAPIEDEITALVRDMGEGLHQLETIYRRYLQMNFPGERLTRPLLMTELARRGYQQMTDGKKWQRGGGRPCRFFPRLKDGATE